MDRTNVWKFRGSLVWGACSDTFWAFTLCCDPNPALVQAYLDVDLSLCKKTCFSVRAFSHVECLLIHRFWYYTRYMDIKYSALGVLVIHDGFCLLN